MIFTDRTIIVQKGTSSINDTIILYRGDKEVEIRFTLNEGSPFRFGSGTSPNIIEKTEAAYGQLVIKTPNDLPSIFSEIEPTNEGKIVFTITAEMIDEITEVGNYTFQIRLFDESRNSRATLPEVVNGIEIREPIATEGVSTSNEVGVATVGYAMTTAGTTEDAFDSQGNYNKTTWGTGDRITAAKLNKMEVAIDGVNKKVASAGTSGGSNINDTTASATTTYSSSKIESIKEDFSSQIKDIENEMQNVGKPTDEQVKNVINEAIANGDIVAGGLTTTAQTLLVNILRNTLFTSDQSESITLLQSELAKSNNGGSSETTQYVISNNLSNATSSNNTVLVNANSSYVTTITANSGYVINSIIVTMGGTNITSSAVSGTTITISSVTGNVVITVTTTVSSSSGGSTELIQNGLVGLFDYRTATVESPYNLIGWGNVAKATFDSCKEYFIFNNTGTYTVDATYGITTNWGIRGIRQTSSPATSLSINGLSNTVIGLVYGKCICNIYGMITTTNMSNEIQFTPKYINSSGSMVSLPSVKITANNYKGGPGYSLYALTESDTELKFYIDGKLMHTVNSSECTDFTKWYTNEECAYPYYNSNDAYTIAFAVYNRPLSATEIVEATEYFKAMEVNS